MHSSFSVLLLLASTALAVPLPRKPNNDDIVGIVGGQPVSDPQAFPFITSLQYKSGASHFCAGSLIAPNLVLTAAHCTGFSARNVMAKAKRYDLKKGSELEKGIDFNVDRWIVHPKYSRWGSQLYDVAIAVVNVTKNWSNGPVPVVKLESDPKSPLASEMQGAMREGGSVTPVLREATVPVISIPECKELYETNADDINDSVVCAGFNRGGTDTCQGDSGGPMLSNTNVLYGITSWGEGCARKGKPGVYTRVSAYLPWIKEQIQLHADLNIPFALY